MHKYKFVKANSEFIDVDKDLKSLSMSLNSEFALTNWYFCKWIDWIKCENDFNDINPFQCCISTPPENVRKSVLGVIEHSNGWNGTWKNGTLILTLNWYWPAGKDHSSVQINVNLLSYFFALLNPSAAIGKCIKHFELSFSLYFAVINEDLQRHPK